MQIDTIGGCMHLQNIKIHVTYFVQGSGCVIAVTSLKDYFRSKLKKW